MKPLVLLLLLTACLAGSAAAQNVTIKDFDIPVSQARTLRFDGAWNWSQSDEKVTANSANARLNYKTFFTSLPLAWFFNIDANAGKNFANLSHSVKIDGSFRKYIWDKEDWFGYTQLTLQHANFYKQIASDLTVGFGFGRYIRATSLAKAVRIEEHLLADGVIKTNLPKKVMLEIANIIERESEYRDIFGVTYETYWFNDITKQILKSNNANEDKLASLGVLRIRQVLFGINERVNERYYGWDLSTGFLFPLSTFNRVAPGNPNATISGRYSYPMGWSMQLNSVAEVFTPMDSTFFKEVTLRTGIDFIYELSNRINFVAGYRLSTIKLPGSSALTDHNLGASFWYYIENNIYLTLNTTLSKPGNSPRVLTSTLGLQYNLF